LKGLPKYTDLAIVGCGPAGISAGIHAARNGINHIVFDPTPGGLIKAANLVENVSFYHPSDGNHLAALMISRASSVGMVTECMKIDGLKQAGGFFALSAGTNELKARAVIIATGTRHRTPDIKIEDCGSVKKLIHFDARTLPPSLSGRLVFVSGGGDAAFDTALNAKKRGAEVEIFFRSENPSAMKLLVKRAGESGIIINHKTRIASIDDSGGILTVSIETRALNVVNRTCSSVVICHGREPEDTLWNEVSGGLVTPREISSGIPGLFCAGDFIRARCRYIEVAAGDGTRACNLAMEYLEKHGNNV